MAGVYQVVTGFRDGRGNFWENVFHFNNSESPTASLWHHAHDLAESFITSMGTTLVALLGNDNTWNVCSAKKVSGAGGPTAYGSVSSFGTGSAPGVTTAFAADIAVFPGGLKNRPGHIYLGGMYDGAIVSGSWVSGFQTAVDAFMTALAGFTTTTDGCAITYGTFTKSTKTCTTMLSSQLNIKVTGMNKRTKPIT
jgi:hypothetical protein